MKIISGVCFIPILGLLLMSGTAQGQIVTETTKKKVSIGVGLFTDIWINAPKGVHFRAINQGFQAFTTYNVMFGKSNFGFGIGLGFSTHNLYGNFLVNSHPDSTRLEPIPDSISYKRSKLCMPYLWIPIEFRFISKTKIAFAIGFKAGYMLPAHSKYVGDDYIGENNVHYPHDELRMKLRGIRNMERFAYGPTIRFGYKWFHVSAYYSLSTIFNKNKGPDVYPVSVGFLLLPF